MSKVGDTLEARADARFAAYPIHLTHCNNAYLYQKSLSPRIRYCIDYSWQPTEPAYSHDSETFPCTTERTNLPYNRFSPPVTSPRFTTLTPPIAGGVSEHISPSFRGAALLGVPFHVQARQYPWKPEPIHGFRPIRPFLGAGSGCGAEPFPLRIAAACLYAVQAKIQEPRLEGAQSRGPGESS